MILATALFFLVWMSCGIFCPLFVSGYHLAQSKNAQCTVYRVVATVAVMYSNICSLLNVFNCNRQCYMHMNVIQRPGDGDTLVAAEGGVYRKM